MEINSELRKKLVSSLMNVLLVLSVLIILFPLYSQPAKALTIRHDDWEVIGPESHTGETFILYGDLYIRDGGSLTLDNCIIEMAYEDPDNGSKIEVEGLGTFNLLNNSLITTNSTSPDPYEFRIDGTALINNSIVEGMADLSGESDGIQIRSSNVTITNSSIRLSNGNGLYLNNSHPTIRNCNIYLNTFYGVYMDSVDNYIFENNIVNSNDIGIYLDHSNSNTITNNTASNGNGDIDLSSSSGNNILNNIVSGNGLGIVLGSSNNNIITGNNASTSVVGIHLASSSNNNITSNYVSYTPYGIHFWMQSNNNSIIGNIISLNSRHGIWLRESSNDNSIIGNIISSNYWDGIYLYSSSNNKITNNTIYSNNFNGATLGSSHNNTISANNISANTLSGIRLSSSNDNKIGMNNISSNTGGVNLTSSSNRNLITSNYLSNNTDYALYMSSSNYNEIIDNNLQYSNYGAYLTSSNNNILYHNNIKNNTLNNASDDGTNQWDNGLEGNWWGNNTNPTDSDGDGICDASFPGTGFVDYKPLANEDNDRVLVDDPWFWFIQSGVNFAEPGWTVYATASTYLENVTINKTLTVIGEDRNSTIIDARGNESVVLVDSTSYVNVSGLTVRNATYGFLLKVDSNYAHLFNNNISDNTQGINITQSSNVIVENNVILNNDVGIYSYNSSPIIRYNNISYNNIYGILNEYYSNSIIGNNTITHNNGHGGIRNHHYSNASIDNNTISNNIFGILCTHSSPIITFNNITFNIDGTIVIFAIGLNLSASDPILHWNNIHDNMNYNLANGYDENFAEINATNNWWGLDPPDDSKIVGKVIYIPWAFEPIEEAGPG